MNSPSSSSARAAGLLIGYTLDRIFGDPRRAHPVATFGAIASTLQQRMYADHRGAGVAYTAVLVGAAGALGVACECASSRSPVARAALTSAATWAVVGGRSLTSEAQAMAAHLGRGDLEQARVQVRNLVGRDPRELDAAELSRATVESVAENTSDAVVAPLFWGAIAGIPGLLVYRAANTLDAMVGHKSPRWLRFGWASARLDDVLNYVPARLGALIVAAVSPQFGSRPSAIVNVVRRDSGQHPSPNAGVIEAAFAGALGVRLGGSNAYGGEREDRGQLGDGLPSGVEDITRAAGLSRKTGSVSAALAGLLAALPLPLPLARTGAAPFANSRCGRPGRGSPDQTQAPPARPRPTRAH